MTARISTTATANLLPVGNFFFVPLDRITASPFQSRQLFDEAELDRLADDIRQHDLLHPIIVRPHPRRSGWFELVSGERRWRAMQRGGWTTQIAANVRDLTDLESAQIAIAENIQRETLTTWEEAQGLVILTREIEAVGLMATNAELARRISKSESYVSKTLLLLNMPEEFQAVAQRHQHVKSSLIEIHQKAPAESVPSLLEQVDQGASFKQVQASIAVAKAEQQQVVQASALGADQETASRASAVQSGGHGTVSRGRRVTGGTSSREALAEIQRHQKSIEAWLPHLSDADWRRVMEPWARELLRGKLSRA